MATSSDLAVLIDYGQNREDAEATTSEKWDMGHHHSAVTLLPSQEQEHMLRYSALIQNKSPYELRTTRATRCALQLYRLTICLAAQSSSPQQARRVL
ncbi:MAG: hypothetical protein L6R39_002611 [Caloplaca ligustica]|nr:MAG: hypothetical protein L6R39_002611 [Caloplaca ligustica]